VRHSLAVGVLAVGVLALTTVTACSSSASSPASAPGSSAESAGPSSGAPAVSGLPRAAAGAAAGSSQVAAAVKAFYDRYVTDPGNADLTAYLTTAAAARLFAPGGDADPVLCAQNTPVSLSFGPPLVRDGEASVSVTTHWAGGTTSGPITVTVALPDVLISGISCPTG
jgi:hypothetical protein